MDSRSPTKGEIFEVKKGTVYLKQTESNHSIRVYLIHVIIIGQFYLHVSLSEYSVTKLRFLDRIFKLVIQVEDTCLIEEKNNTSTYCYPFSYILHKIYMDKIKSLKVRHFKEN